MQALILAAGMGKRLKELTARDTKCLIRVNGVPLIDRMLAQLERVGVSRVILVVGYQAERLKEHLAGLAPRLPIEYVENPIYDRTNNIYSLYLARERLMEEDSLLLESDLIFEDAALDRLLAEPYPNLALVAKYESWMDGTMVTLDRDRGIRAFLDKEEFRFAEAHTYYKTVNIYKFSREFARSRYVPFLEAYCRALGHNEYYEQVLKVIAHLKRPELKALPLAGEKWYEIDDKQDLDIAESIFTPGLAERAERLGRRYGGYWRYPELLDFCYLVNPFYPPPKLMEEIKANFCRLVGHYPSGQAVNSLLAAKYFGLDPETVAVGNGAAELIQAELREPPPGRLGLAAPSFEEYLNRIGPDRAAVFSPSAARDFRFSADDLMEHFEGLAEPVWGLALVNPDNPSGNFIPRPDLLRLAAWAEETGRSLIVDESFVDFADEPQGASLLDQGLLAAHPRLLVIRSISKSFGVPGLRLGLAAGGDPARLARLKKNLAIWNINSPAEFFLQIFEKYQPDYAEALARFRAARREMAGRLGAIGGLRVLPSQANYLMVELTGPVGAGQAAAALLGRDILVKNLGGKKGIEGQYLRLAVRRPEENEILAAALEEILAPPMKG